MKFSSAFPSKYLKPADLNGDEPVMTIKTVTMEEVGEDRRPVIYFNESKKGLVLNKTNGTRIANQLGDDMGEWVGGKVKLYEEEAEMNGRTFQTVRVRMPKSQPKADVAAPKPAKQKYEEKDLDDEIPF